MCDYHEYDKLAERESLMERLEEELSDETESEEEGETREREEPAAPPADD